jgi:hypothetical protein
MELQYAGPLLALVTFLTIWWGHVLVRIVHYYFGTRPAPAIILLGLLALLGSTQTNADLLSASLGIVGLTLIWDSFELHRQEARVRQGHAPLNPRVHRKAAGMLAANMAAEREDDEGTCLSCGSNPNSRFLCRRGPYCKVKHWERYSASMPGAEGNS